MIEVNANQSRDYVAMLREGHANTGLFEGRPTSRLAFLSDHIFDFTTYDTDMAELFARKALEVCAAISDGTTYEYIKDKEQYLWYLLMCNTPFFASRIEWGTSIRGAWWNYDDTTFSSCGLFANGEQCFTDETVFTNPQWREFIAAVVAFGAEDHEHE